jgi:multiple sugar transport system permease protein
MRDRYANNWRGYMFVAPATIYLAAFAFFPMVFAGYLSLHRWHLLKEDRPFVGLDNFAQMFSDPFFRNAIYNTLIYVVFSVPLGVITSLAVAALVAQRLRGIGVFRTLYYIPAVSSQVAISMVWIWILLPEVGLINWCWARLGSAVNAILGALGAGPLSAEWMSRLGLDGSTNFLMEPGWAMAALVAMSLWIGLGPRMIIFMAGIQSIPETLYEAAAIDGATGWRRFRHVTLPLLAPTTLFVVVTTTIASFQLFTPVYVMTKGGPRRTTDVVLYHIYKEAWQKFDVGMASAMSYVLFAMILVVALVQLRIMRRGLTEGAAE